MIFFFFLNQYLKKFTESADVKSIVFFPLYLQMLEM